MSLGAEDKFLGRPLKPLREDSLPVPGAAEVQGDVVPSGTPPPGYQEQDPLRELGQLASSWKTPGKVIVI